MNLSIVILPAKVLANGKHKIRIAMSHRGTTRYFVTRFVVPSPKNLKNGQIVGKEIGNASYINMQLSEQMQNIYRAFDEIADVDCYSCAQLLEMIKNRLNRVSLKSFDAVAAEWLELKKRQDKDESIKLFEYGIAAFKEFAKGDFLLPLLTSQKVFEYQDFLTNKKHYSETTTNMRVGVLRSIVAYARRRKYVEYNVAPFQDYRELDGNIRDIALQPETMRALINLQTDDANVQTCRDCLLLSFYMAGINLKDLFALDLSVDVVSFVRIKTQRRRKDLIKTEFTIQPEARAIINKYINASGRIKFGDKSTVASMNAYFYRHLDKIASMIGVDKLIYYSMRKTFAQTANALGISERIIAYCIGDSFRDKNGSIKYYIKTTREMADDTIRRVIDYATQKETQPE